MSDVDYHLRNQVAQVNRMVIQLQEQVGHVSGQVHAVDARTQTTQAQLQELRNDFAAFVEESKRMSHVQRAETRVGVVQDKLDIEYGHHKVVRRSATGLLQAFDVGLVSEEAVHSVSDELMIQTPRYWLAPTLIALAAWSRDDRSLCERAVEEAFRRSPDRTSLFFALVLRRQNRRDESVRWLRHYLGTQDPAALGREFAVILESIAQGAFGLAGRELLRTTLEDWQERLLLDNEARAAQVLRWRGEVESLRPPSTAAEFPRLAKVSPQWPELDGALRSARAQQAVLEKYTAIMEREFTPTERLEDAVDDILDRLVSEYDDDELPLRRELAFNEAVIAHHGDLSAARQAAELQATAYEETLDYLTVQSTAALDPPAIGTSPATQRLAIAACRHWFAEAHAGYTRDYRMAVPDDVTARFGVSQHFQTAVFTLPEWSGSFRTALPELEKSLSDHWDRHVRPFVDSLAYPWRRMAIAPVVVSVLVLIVVGSNHIGYGLLGAAAVGGIWGAVIHKSHRDAVRRQQQVQEQLDRAKQASLHDLRGASAELTDWTTRQKEADAVEARTRELIASLETAGHGGSPFEGRTVAREDAT